MNKKPTRNNTNFTNMTIDSLSLPVKSEKPKGDLTKIDEDITIDLNEETTAINKVNSNVSEKLNDLAGHDLNDQPVEYTNKQKFNGQGNVEQWLKQILEELDSVQLSSNERNNFIPEILTGEALIWYFKQQCYMPTFNSFVQNVLYHYGTKNVHQERLPSSASPLNKGEKADPGSLDPVDPSGSWWILMNPDGSYWILWILLDPPGSSWILLDPIGS
jgi:hypothetical protein